MIWYALAASVLLLIGLIFFLVLPLRRRLDAQREIVHNLQHRFEGIEKETGLTAHRLQEQHGRLSRLADEQHRQLDDMLKKQTELREKMIKRLRRIDDAVLRLQTQQNELDRKIENTVASAPPKPKPPDHLRIDSPLVTEVLELLAQGKAPTEIAREKGIQLGEIDLIRGLKHFAGK
ncbi:MAG: hypothetical protein QNK37_34250 [Acidobacteriota bacterium]|nr:hypothetical protein [Acidobacteriota bacterium]